MNKVLAALSNDLAAGPVAATSIAVAGLLHASAHGVHVRQDGTATVSASARAAGIDLHVLAGPEIETLRAAAEPEAVAAIVVGARSSPGGARPAGSTALELITSLRKPVVVVPPDTRHPGRLRSILVPLDGTRESSDALAGTIELACGSGIEVIALHVLSEGALPSFSDQPQHEARAWASEFMARWSPRAAGELELKLRVGRAHEHVTQLAEEAAVDALALGWSQSLARGRALVVREALARSRVPVLLLPVSVSD